MHIKNQKIIICGPTASGKSALAVQLAQNLGAVIVNSDSQQVYREIPILSAQPTEEEKQVAPHYLFGVVSGAEGCNVAKWLEMVKTLPETRKPVIYTGGTGMYLNALVRGLSAIPEIPPEIRERVRGMEVDEVAAALGDRADGNTQRMRRALEVWLATGKHIEEFHEEAKPAGDDFTIFNLIVSRETIYENINSRFLKMIEAGAVEEVRKLVAMKLDPALPVMKACGVPELAAYLRGEVKLEEAITRAQQVSRNYAKRQMTWFRHQLGKEAISIASFDEILIALKRRARP